MDALAMRQLSNESTEVLASYGNQKTYWIWATVHSSFGAIAMLVILADSRKNRNYNNPVVRCFGPMLFGDLLFLINFWPYHMYNTIQALSTNGEFDPGESPICRISWCLAGTAIMFELYGLVLISATPYRMLSNAKKMKRLNSVITTKQLVLFYITCTIAGLIWYFGDFNKIGSFKKLYCGPVSWAGFSGVWIFSWIFLSFGAVGFFILKSYLMIKGSGIKKSDSGKSNKAVRNVLKYGVFMLASFLICFGSFATTTFLNVIGIAPAIEFEMFTGLTVKLKSILDCMILYNLDILKAGRSGRKIYATTNNTTTVQSSAVTELDKH